MHLCKNAFCVLECVFLFCKKGATFDGVENDLCKNAFDAKMHLMQKCIFRVHFPKENVQLCKNAFLRHIFLWKMFSCAKMHLMLQNIFIWKNVQQSHFPK